MRGLQTLLVLLAGAYIVQTLTPLPLCPDAVTLLSMSYSAFDGSGFPQTQFPIRYPVILLVMERFGVAFPPVTQKRSSTGGKQGIPARKCELIAGASENIA
jgi:hypothetical protein